MLATLATVAFGAFAVKNILDIARHEGTKGIKARVASVVSNVHEEVSKAKTMIEAEKTKSSIAAVAEAIKTASPEEKAALTRLLNGEQ